MLRRLVVVLSLRQLVTVVNHAVVVLASCSAVVHELEEAHEVPEAALQRIFLELLEERPVLERVLQIA